MLFLFTARLTIASSLLRFFSNAEFKGSGIFSLNGLRNSSFSSLLVPKTTFCYTRFVRSTDTVANFRQNDVIFSADLRHVWLFVGYFFWTSESVAFSQVKYFWMIYCQMMYRFWTLCVIFYSFSPYDLLWISHFDIHC